MQDINPDVVIPVELKLASAAVPAAYGYQVVSTEKAKALSAAGRKEMDEKNEVSIFGPGSFRL